MHITHKETKRSHNGHMNFPRKIPTEERTNERARARATVPTNQNLNIAAEHSPCTTAAVKRRIAKLDHGWA